MPRPLNPLRAAGPVLLAVVGSLGWSVTAAAQPAPVRTGVLQLDERRGAVILDTPQLSGSAEIIDESALRFYAAQRQGERVQAEIARLRRRHPNWTVPADLDTLKPSPPEEAPMWDLFTAGRFDELRTAISVRQSADPGWQPSEDLARKLNRGTLRSAARAAVRDGAWEAIIARVKASQETVQNLDIDIAWTLAEAYARTGDLAQASTVYRTLLTEQTDAGLRLATVQKAMAAMPIASVEPLLTLGSRGADGADEFRAIRPDVTRARMVAVLHGEPAGRIEPAELAAVGGLHVAERLGVHVARVRIERRQHAVDGRLDHLRLVRLLDVVGADLLEDVAEQAELAVGLGRGGHGPRTRQEVGLGRHHGRSGTEEGAEHDQGSLAHQPRTFSPSTVLFGLFAHHGSGSMEPPSFLNST